MKYDYTEVLRKQAAPNLGNIGGILDDAIAGAGKAFTPVVEAGKKAIGNPGIANAAKAIGKIPATAGRTILAGGADDAAAYIPKAVAAPKYPWLGKALSGAGLTAAGGTAGAGAMYQAKKNDYSNGQTAGDAAATNRITQSLTNRSSWETFVDFIKKLFGKYNASAITAPTK